MKKFYRLTAFVVIAVMLAAHSYVQAAPALAGVPQASATAFHFVFTADSRDDYSVLPALSHKMVTLNPAFGFFAGDLCGSFDVNCINNTWKPAMDGNNRDGMLARTFVSRGNHDSGSLSSWQGLCDFQPMATRVGATHYTALTADATYSFDYGNSHFAVIDLPGGGPNSWSSAEISWLDADLTAAEGRRVAHEFIFSHGPMYGVTSQHGSEQPSSALKAVLNKHPISAGFHGHEHVTAYTHVTPSREAGINDYQQFTMGRAGAPSYSVAKPVDWSANQNAFADIAVNGNTFKVTVYAQNGSSLFTKTFTDGSPTPGATTVAFRSIAASDGSLLEAGQNRNVGGALDATGTTFALGDDGLNRQFRAILSFNTSSLPDNAVIRSVLLKVQRAGQTGANPFATLGTIAVDIQKGAFANNPALQSGDFQAAASRDAALAIANNPVSGWYSRALGSANFIYINKVGLTQLRLRFKQDDNNNHVADYLTFFSGNCATPAYRPVLIIRYSVP